MLSGMLAAWVATLAGHLHGRTAWRLQRLVVGVILAQGRRTVTSWFRAAGITIGYRSYYNWVVLARLVKHAHAHVIGLPLWATLYVRRCDVPAPPRGVTPWGFRTELERAA